MSAMNPEDMDEETRSAIHAQILAEHEQERANAKTVEQAQATTRTDDLDRHFAAAGFTIENPTGRYKDTSYRRLTKGEKRWVVAYKTDWKLFETHRVFIESWSTWRSGKSGAPGRGRKGWAVDGRFDVVVIYSPQGGYFWWIPRHRLEEKIKQWGEDYGIHEVLNTSWITLGSAVPETELETIGKKVQIETVKG